jgi:hypothetical protein
MPLTSDDATDRPYPAREPSQRLSHLDRGCFWPFLTFSYADKDALPLAQTHYACPLKRGDVHEDIVSAAVQDDETEPLGGVVPLHRPHLLDARLQGLSV